MGHTLSRRRAGLGPGDPLRRDLRRRAGQPRQRRQRQLPGRDPGPGPLGAGLDWQRTKIDAYAETGGAGLALFVPGRAITSRRGRLDATLARTFSAGWGVWQPLARLGWRHEFANPARPLAVSFPGDAAATPVVFATDDADANWGEAGLGAVFVFAGGHSAFVEYRQRFGHEFLQERILAIGWRIGLP